MSNKKEILNDVTGEILAAPKFRSMWSNPYGFEGLDYSNELEDVYEEIAPYALDAKTGGLLNNSSIPKVVKTGQVNVKEKINSFAKEVDLYSILEKFAYSNDPALLNARACSYGDISNFPDNLNDYAQYVNKHVDNLKSLNPELGKMVIDDSYSAEDIEKRANEIFNERIKAQNNDVKKEGNE